MELARPEKTEKEVSRNIMGRKNLYRLKRCIYILYMHLEKRLEVKHYLMQ